MQHFPPTSIKVKKKITFNIGFKGNKIKNKLVAAPNWQ